MRENQTLKKRKHTSRGRKSGISIALLLLVLLVTMSVGGTLAYLAAKTETVINTFQPTFVETEVEETFDEKKGDVKSNVTAKNIGETDAYIRIKLITYREDGDGNRIGGTAEIPAFTPGTGWVEYPLGSDTYIYTQPVAVGKYPGDADEYPGIPLIGTPGIELQEYTDVDGGIQVIEVMAEAIQSEPAKAVGEAWGVVITPNNVAKYNPNTTTTDLSGN